MRKVIVNADDFGYSRGINWGIIDAHTQSILTSATLMTNMPGFEHACELALKHPNLGVGIHLVLSCGSALLKTHKTICDEQGHFLNQDFYKHETYDLAEVYDEWDAQIQKALAHGIVPTHLDSHHHAHTFQHNSEIIEALARKYDLPVRTNYEASEDIRGIHHFIWDFDECGSRIKEEDHIYLDALMKSIMNYEVTEIMCHPGYLDYTVSNRSQWLENRINVLEFMIHSDFSKLLKHNPHIQLVSYKEL